MRDKLIDIILAAQGYKESGEIADGYKAVYEAELAARKREAAKIADHLIAHGVTVQEWVSVEDALPEIGAMVLLYHTKYKYFSLCTLQNDGDPYWKDEELVEFNIHYGTHWMALPAPPKEE